MYSYDLQITSGTDWQAIANLGTSSGDEYERWQWRTDS